MLDNESRIVVEEAAKLVGARVDSLARSGASVDALEELTIKLVRAVGRRALERTTQARVDQAVTLAKVEGFRIERTATVGMTGVFGCMEVESPYLRKAGVLGAGRRPARDLGIDARGRTSRVQRALVDFGAEESFGAAAKRFEEHYGTVVERTAVLRLVETHGERAERFVAERLTAAEAALDSCDGRRPAGVPELLLEMDGCELRTGRLERPTESDETTPVRELPKAKRVTEWRDVRMGLVRPLGEVDPTYVGRLDKLAVVAQDLRGAACIRGLGPSTKVIACCDGAKGYREALSEQFPDLQYILDRPHFLQHLNEAAKAIGLDDPSRRRWVAEHAARIELGPVQDVIDEFKRYTGSGEERVWQLAGYLDRHSDAIDYDRYRANGWPVGSGEIESCHRHIPQRRLKLPGAWWSVANLQRMLALRILRANGWWDEFWRMPDAA